MAPGRVPEEERRGGREGFRDATRVREVVEQVDELFELPRERGAGGDVWIGWLSY